jgi:hypothetical protein
LDFPPEYIAGTLTGFCVCYFRNTTHDPEAPPHYHITIPVSDDTSLLLCVITSQVENKARYYQKTNKEALSSVVSVNRSSLVFLKKESVIDCNHPVLVRKNKFNMLVDPDHKFKVVARDVPDEVKEKIIKAIKASPIVKPFIKKMVKWP